MKKTTLLLKSLALALLFTSCQDTFGDDEIVTDNPVTATPPTAEEFNALREEAYNNMKQEFTANADDMYVTLTSEKGVIVSFYTNCLTKNGQPVTGGFDIEFVEIFERGNMLASNKPTMGNDNGQMRLLISGGEFYVNATQGGVQLESNCGYMISVPVEITGGEDNDMATFTGTLNTDGQVIWNPESMEMWMGPNEQAGEGSFYNVFVNSFGWFNCDKFAAYDGPFTQIEVFVPQGYDTTNSGIFIAVQGEPNALGSLYGEYPVGLECYIIFVTSNEDDTWSYAVKTVTLEENASYTFTPEELQPITEAGLIDAINALP